MSDHSSTQELIHKIEVKDRKFRTAQAIFMLLLFAVLTGIIFVQFRTLDTVKQQLAASKATAAETTKQSTQQRQVIIRRLDCMVAFFSQKDRANLSIANIDTCSISKDSNLQQFFPQPATTTTPSSNQNPSSSTPTNSPTSSNPGNTTPQSSTQQPIMPPVTVEPKPPVTVFGVPVCVPFTGICVR